MVSPSAAVPSVDLVELGDPVDEVADLGAELLGQRLQRVAGVLHGVVQQRGDQRGGVHLELGQDVGDGQRVGDVGVTGAAHLVGVALLGDLVRALQQRQVRLRVDLAVHGDQRLEHRVDGAALGGHPACQPGAHPPRRARRRLGRIRLGHLDRLGLGALHAHAGR